MKMSCSISTFAAIRSINGLKFRLTLTLFSTGLLLMFNSLLSSQDLETILADNAQPAQQESESLDTLQALQLTSQAFRRSVERIKPSLVTIESFGGMRTQQGRIGGIRGQGEGPTTGVLISEDGFILTSTFNFIQNQPLITVITSDGQRHVARLLGRDDTRKICLLKINEVKNIPLPQVVPQAEIKVGQWAISAGVGYGDVEPAISTGIISAKNRIGGRAVQTDANISPANYGGPLLDIRGRLIGICVPLNPQSQAIGAGVEWYDSGIGFAVPIDGNQELIERLKQGQRIQPAFLGVQVTAHSDLKGVIVEAVVPESPAARVGLQVNDVITQLDGQPIEDLMMLKQVMNRFESGRRIELHVIKRTANKKNTESNQDEQQQSAQQNEWLDETEQGPSIQPIIIEVELAPPPPMPGEIDPLQPPKIR
jgi:serine protease Do